jgi:hypothetical protein
MVPASLGEDQQQLIDACGEMIEEGVCSLKRFTDINEGVEMQYGLYFGKETNGKAQGKIYLTNGKIYEGIFKIDKYVFEPTKGALFSYDGTLMVEGKWAKGKCVD